MTGPNAPIAHVLGSHAFAGLFAALTRRKTLDRLGGAFFLIGVLVTAVYGWVRPDYNWDMVAYVATALEDRYSEAEDLHRATWAVIEEGAGEANLFNLKSGNPYNLHQWENPRDFQSQLSMYRVKVGYVGLIRLLEPFTGLATATILLSILPALGLGLLLFWWMREQGALQAGFVVLPLLMIGDFAAMTTAVVPDMLLAFLSVAAICALLRGRDLMGTLLLFASVFVRPDNIILIFALLIAAVLFNWRKTPLALCFALSFAACEAIARVGGHPGWWAHFYFSCVHIQNSMAGFHPDFSLLAVLKGYARGVTVGLMHSDWPALFVLLVAAWALLARAGAMAGGRSNAVVFALAIGTLGKFASFPLPDDRFYFAFIASMTMILALRWHPQFGVDTAAAAQRLGSGSRMRTGSPAIAPAE